MSTTRDNVLVDADWVESHLDDPHKSDRSHVVL